MSLQAALDATHVYLIKQKLVGVTGLPTLGSQYGIGDVPWWIPSGNIVIDQLLGGGLPGGRISEIFSREESEGKTTLLILFAIMTQRMGGVVVWLESESSIDKHRAQRMGLNLDMVVFHCPETLEAGFLYVANMLTNIRLQPDLREVPILIVWDTIAAAEAKATKSGDEYSEGMINKPRIMSEALRDLCGSFWGHRVHMAFVNQSITKVEKGGAAWGGPKLITPGGRALKFYATIRIELHKVGTLFDANDQPIGLASQLHNVKNKISVPMRRADLELVSATGFDEVGSMAQLFLPQFKFKKEKDEKAPPALGESLGIIKVSGSWYETSGMALDGSVASGVRGQGYDAFVAAVRANEDAQRYWRACVAQIWPLPPDRQRGPDGWVRPVTPPPPPPSLEIKPPKFSAAKEARDVQNKDKREKKGKKALERKKREEEKKP